MSPVESSFEKLKKYAVSLGLTVFIRPRTKIDDFSGSYMFEDKKIILTKKAKSTTTDLILTLLHELGHHLDFVHKNKKENDALVKALLKRDYDKKPLTPRERKLIYEDEVAAANYMLIIYKELDLKIPKHKVEAEVKLDKWIAEQYFLTGEEPTVKQSQQMRKEFLYEVKKCEE